MIQNAVVILPAGGTSSRFGATNKLLCPLNGMPVFCHAIRTFLKLVPPDRIALSVNRDFRSQFEDALALHFPGCGIRIVNGGESRTESVFHALELFAAERPAYVAVHDAARPLISPELAESAFKMCSMYGAALVARKVTDTVKKIGMDGMLGADGIDRETLWAVETPQIFLYSELLSATRFAISEKRPFTDDAAVIEHYCGRRSFPVENRGVNLKITHEADLELAQKYLAAHPEA